MADLFDFGRREAAPFHRFDKQTHRGGILQLHRHIDAVEVRAQTDDVQPCDFADVLNMIDDCFRGPSGLQPFLVIIKEGEAVVHAPQIRPRRPVPQHFVRQIARVAA